MFVRTGVVIKTRVDMLQWAEKHTMPESLMEVVPAGSMVAHTGGDDSGLSVEEKKSLFVIPMEYDDYPETEAICMTGHTQMKWIAQLVYSKTRWCRAGMGRACSTRIECSVMR